MPCLIPTVGVMLSTYAPATPRPRVAYAYAMCDINIACRAQALPTCLLRDLPYLSRSTRSICLRPGAICLCPRYAMSDTDVPYGPTRRIRGF
eukprot:3230516-Rhodomonas_salina.2